MALPSPTLLRHLETSLPDATAAPPAGYQLLEANLGDGLPARFALDARLTLALVVPTGLARTWLATDPDAVVCSSDDEGGPGVADAGRVSARLVLIADERRVGASPLVRGAELLMPSDAGRPAEISVLPLGWRITAGAMVGPGSTGSWLRLAWRRIGVAAP